MRQLIAASAKQLNLSTVVVRSGATHDAQSLGRLAPMGMIFVPSVGGVSHAPGEFTRPEDVVNGVNVLLLTALQLDAQNWYLQLKSVNQSHTAFVINRRFVVRVS